MIGTRVYYAELGTKVIGTITMIRLKNSPFYVKWDDDKENGWYDGDQLCRVEDSQPLPATA